MNSREETFLECGLRPRVLWVTNMAAPYRRPVWAALAEGVELHVRVLHSDSQFEKAQQRGNRGRDWRVDSAGLGNAELAAARTRMLRVKGRRWFFLAERASGAVEQSLDAVVLGGWEQPAYWQLLRAATRRGVRTIGFYESTLATSRHRSGLVARARASFFRRLDAVVVPGVAAGEAVRAMGVDERRIFLGFNAIDTSAFVRDSGSSRTAEDGHAFLYVGQLIARKNVLALIDAFAAARREHDRLTLVGKGELSDAIEAAIDRHGLRDHIIMRGPQAYEELPAIMHRHDTLVLPSTEEVWGLVVNEALTAGMHVVVSEVSGVAPSVSAMDGVFVSGTAPGEIALAMRQSREQWAGHIANPQILAHTPEQLAGVFDSAIRGVQ